MSIRSNTLTVFAFCLLLAGCGGGSSTPSTTPDGDSSSGESILTGVFVDSPVEGVAFATETQSGTTNAAGEFSYLAGEQVTFSIGAAQLPAVAAAAQVTPVDIAASSATPAAMTTNIARLLQSLDQDGNPDNGITISADAAISAPQLNFDVSTAEFENNAEVINLVANSGSVNTSLISAEDANSHLNSTLGNEATSNVVTDGRITTPEQFTATLVGSTFVGQNEDGSRDESTRLLSSTSDMTISGTFGGESINLDWYWEDEYYCRSGQSGDRTVELECQVVTISNSVVTFTDDRGAGDSRSYFIENGAETLPTIIDFSLSSDMPPVLTVSFSTDMTPEFKTEGEYVPSRTYWQDPRTFIVEFESVQQGGSIRLIPEFFIAVSGDTLTDGLEVAF